MGANCNEILNANKHNPVAVSLFDQDILMTLLFNANK